MKKIIILLFMFMQICVIAQNNVVTELWAANGLNAAVVISTPHEILWYDNQNGGSDMEVEFMPTAADIRNMKNNISVGNTCTVVMILKGQKYSTSGKVILVEQIETTYKITISGVQILYPYK